MHKNINNKNRGIRVRIEKAETLCNILKNAGFDVIVFVPSYDEDLGLITCGNAILSGSVPKVSFTDIKQ